MLNAFRHQRSGHDGVFSTTFIMPGAQRLSASKIMSHLPPRPGWMPIDRVLNAFRHQRSGHRCAGKGTDELVFSAQRLSASKIRSPVTSASGEINATSAQRLSASKIRSPLSTPQPSKTGTSAQRLSASKIRSRTIQVHNIAKQPVLNAFRHQRSGHARLSSSTSSTVGAQRLSASKIRSHI